MTKSIEISGRTEDEAIESALAQLGLTRDDVSVEIVERAKTGFLGLKSTPAIVRVLYEVKDDKANQVEVFLKGLLTRMEVEAGMEISEGDGSVEVTLTGSDPGSLIGRRGETLDAIQHLTNYVINRGNAGRTRVNIDAENYRQRRNETLETLASRTAGKVAKYRRNITLDPMNAYERHVIHTALQDYENVTTYSIGSEPNRRIVVAYGRNAENAGRSRDSSTGGYRDSSSAGYRDSSSGGHRDSSSGGHRDSSSGRNRDSSTGGYRDSSSGGHRAPAGGRHGDNAGNRPRESGNRSGEHSQRKPEPTEQAQNEQAQTGQTQTGQNETGSGNYREWR